MPIRTITALPDPVLRRKARPVTRTDKRLQALIDDMIETMRAAPGVGLAAPQVSVSERLIVVEFGAEDEEEPEEGAPPPPKKLYVMINPEIVKASDETVSGVEGCLSVPGLVGEVERPLAVTVRGRNRHGHPVRVKAEGWLARIFLHEIDHLDGVLFTDRATRIWKPETPIEDNV